MKPEDLVDASEVYTTKSGRRDSVRIRDIKKRMKSGKELKILALESQSNVNYIMPWRCMDYDSREYGEQIRVIQKKNRDALKERKENIYENVGERLCEFKRSDRLVLVYTISVLIGVDTFMEKKEKYKNEEGYNMCQALRELVEDSRM